MSLLTLQGVGITTPTLLFKNLNLTIDTGKRIGIVAGNGKGKTTLLKCMAQELKPEHGTITRARGLKMAFVRQEVPPDLLYKTLYEVVLSGLPKENLESQTWLVDMLLESFETPPSYYQKPLHQLSGGWQKMAVIARAWMNEPDVIFLDEPTNHLDMENIKRLEKWIDDNAWQITMVIVSHDRSFLDSSTTHTLFMRPEGSKLYAHSYQKARALLQQDDEREATVLDKNKKEAARLRRSANEHKNIGINRNDEIAQKKAKLLFKRAEKLERTFKKLHKDHHAKIKFDSTSTHAKTLLSIEDTVIRTPDGTALFKTRKQVVRKGDRIVLLGGNGSGKSQFIKHLMRAWSDQSETVRFAHALSLGYMDQQMSHLPTDQSLFDYLSHRFSLEDLKCRILLAGAGFPVERQIKTIETFSSGEKARLCMLVLRLSRPHFYLLDEPTNHVDIHGQEKLEEEILKQNASYILASHDRMFVQNTATRFWEIQDKKLVERNA